LIDLCVRGDKERKILDRGTTFSKGTDTRALVASCL